MRANASQSLSYRWLPSLLWLGLLAGGARAQYRFDHWTADNGLPQNSVYAITQTGDGYLWLATVDGLARFDGVRFTIFNKSNSPGIVNNRFISLFEDSSGDLWAGTEESGVARFHDGRFTTYGEAEGAPRNVTGISGDAEGNAIFHAPGKPTFHFADGKFSPFDGAANISGAVRAVRRRSIGKLCLPVGDFPKCYADGKLLEFSPAAGAPPYQLLMAVQDADGNFWLLTKRREVARVENGKVVRVFNEASGLPKRPLKFITGAKTSLLSLDEQESLWLTDLETMRSELLLKSRPDAPHATGAIYSSYLAGESGIHSAYQDGEGNLWFGTLRGGLFRARKQVVTALSTAVGLTDSNVYPIYEGPDGVLWVGTTKGLFTYQNGHFALVASTENFYVQAIGKDADGRIVVSDQGALYVREANRFAPFLREKLPAQRQAYAIYSDRDGALWIGGDNGLTRFKEGAATTFTTAEGLAGNDVKVIIEAKAGGLWVGTYDGLTRIENGRLTSWREANGLPSRTVRAVYEDTDGTLWIGSYDGGVARFKDGKFTHYNSSIGLYNDGAFQILEDGRRWFWISSNRGIYRVNKDELNEFADGKRKTITAIAYGKSDGMLNVECNGGRSPGGTRTRDGRLWFPTQDGVAVIDPTTITTNLRPPPVVIESFLLDRQPLAFDGGVQLKPGQTNFEIGYTALSFINSEHLRFKYRLENLERAWIEAGARRAAYYSHVPPGDYLFRVIAANSDGVWNEQGQALRIRVLPPFYRTWWFLILTVCLTAGLLLCGFKYRIRQLQRAQAAQQRFAQELIESQEGERKRIAAELHDSLGQSLAMIKNSAVFGAQTATDLPRAQEQLVSISAQSAQAISEVREIAHNLRPYLLDRLGLTRALRSLLNKVADTSQLQLSIEIDELEGLFPAAAEMSIYRLLQESLNNILKHAAATQVRVAIKNTERYVIITVTDNGCGFDTTALGNGDGQGRGFGLLSLAERVRILGGVLTINSAPGAGTSVVIKINRR